MARNMITGKETQKMQAHRNEHSTLRNESHKEFQNLFVTK